MANGFGSLFIGVSGLQSSQNGLNTTANNLSNIDTKGYVRQRVFYSDRDYLTFNQTAAVSKQQSGLGVKIGDVRHTRDVFLDKSYRSTYGRYQFYDKTAEASREVETYFQELEGKAFQEGLEDLWISFEELSKYPEDSVYQELVIQKSQLFISRASAVYSGLQTYQYNINTQIEDNIDRMNELGKFIEECNMAIRKIETAGIETAMTLRDERDKALDELAGLVELDYYETADGILKISIDSVEFVNENGCNRIGMRKDPSTGFVDPYWEFLSDPKKNQYIDVMDFRRDISPENQNDKGSLKALILARGDHVADYRDIEGLTQKEYNDNAGMSVMLKAEAMIDQLIHKIVTSVNDIFAPNTEASNYIQNWDANGNATLKGSDGKDIVINKNTLILDADNCPVGSDKKLPPRELFTRIGCERYTEATDDNGNVYYIYNEEDLTDSKDMYTIRSLSVNQELLVDETLMPHLMQNQNGDMVAVDAIQKLSDIWEQKDFYLNPNDLRPIDFKSYYISMSNDLATFGNVYEATADSLSDGSLSTDNARQQVIGVSADEELVTMIKYQNAYNAASRFINVINEMIEHLITQLG